MICCLLWGLRLCVIGDELGAGRCSGAFEVLVVVGKGVREWGDDLLHAVREVPYADLERVDCWRVVLQDLLHDGASGLPGLILGNVGYGVGGRQ